VGCIAAFVLYSCILWADLSRIRVIKIKHKHESVAVSGTSSYSFSAEGVDLVGLFQIIWRAKQHILVSVCCSVLIGLLASFLLPQKWTSKSIITPSEPTQSNLLMQMLAPIQTLGVNVDIDRDGVFNLFLKKFQSQQEIKEYIILHPTQMAPFKDANVDAVALNKAIVMMSEKMKAANDNGGKKNDSVPYSSWTLSFTAPNPVEAQSILKGYIGFIAEKVVTQSLKSVRDAVVLETQIRRDKLALERAKLGNLQDVKIKRLNYSLQVAKAARIIRPIYSNGQVVKDDPDFSIVLGADGIARKLEIEKSITDVAELDSGLRNDAYQLSLLENVSVEMMTFPVLHYQQATSLPLESDGPKTGMIGVLAALLGGLSACAAALLSEAWVQRYSENELSEFD
jgi:LPS O-antigen subunit length determinant protein (WzzB/FepE family)